MSEQTSALTLAALSRLVENLLRIGTVSEVDHGAGRCRVKLGNIETAWLLWFHARAGETRTWDPPTFGEQCMVLSPSGEPANGIVLYGISQNEHPTPSSNAAEHVVVYPDGARISYNHASGALQATGIQTALIAAAVSVTLDTPLTHCTGKLVVDDLLTYGNGIAGTGGDNNNIITGNFVQTGGELSSNGVVLDTHTHPENDSGGPTGAPNGGG
jgi:phage baseplate assembly protein V